MVSFKNSLTPLLYWLALTAICLLGGWLRWQYIQTNAFHVDEFISMLAIRMVLEKGQPVLPSGLFYDNGLLFTYLGALVAQLDQNNLLVVRWLSLAWGVGTIFLIGFSAWVLFKDRAWGLMAALFIAIYPDAIEWGGRVRMYAQANVMLLLWILLIWWGTLGGPYRWARWLFIFSLWIGLNTHFVLILLLPPLAIALLVVLGLASYQEVKTITPISEAITHITSQVDRPSRLFIEVIIAAFVLGLTVWLAGSSFMAQFADEVPNLEAETLMAQGPVATKIIDISLTGERWGKLYRYLTQTNILPLTVFALAGTLILILKLKGRSLSKKDLAGLLIAGMLGLTLLELAVVIDSEWAKTRYNYILLILPLLLLSVYSLQAITHLIINSSQSLSPGLKFTAVTGLAILGVGWPISSNWTETMAVISGATSSPNRYNIAFEKVDQMRQPVDQLLTIRPAAAYLYSNKLDFYTNQGSEVIMPSDRGWIDRYVGVPYLAGVAEFNQVIDNAGDLWFVIDDERLFENLSSPVTQQVLHRMELVDQVDNVLIFREVENSWPLSEHPAVPIVHTLENDLRFIGYSVSPLSSSPGATIYITTFWQGGDALLSDKLFVHLRNSQNNNVAQVDLFIFSQFDDELAEELIDQAEGDSLRIGATLSLPPDLPAGQYSLWTGLYAADTLQRLSIIDDSQLSNEISLGTIMVGP